MAATTGPPLSEGTRTRARARAELENLGGGGAGGLEPPTF